MCVDHRHRGPRLCVLDFDPGAELFGKRLNVACAEPPQCSCERDDT